MTPPAPRKVESHISHFVREQLGAFRIQPKSVKQRLLSTGEPRRSTEFACMSRFDKGSRNHSSDCPIARPGFAIAHKRTGIPLVVWPLGWYGGSTLVILCIIVRCSASNNVTSNAVVMLCPHVSNR